MTIDTKPYNLGPEEPPEEQPKKLCKDCKFLYFKSSTSELLCKRGELSLYDGKPEVSIKKMRLSEYALCGPEGKLFQSNEPVSFWKKLFPWLGVDHD